MTGWMAVGHAIDALGPWYSVAAIGGTYGVVFVIAKRTAQEVLS